MKNIKPELLSPAGSFEALTAAAKAGADAVYLGGKTGNARMNAKNFTNDELIKASEYAHSRNIKIYLTLNTLYTDRELVEILKFVEFAVNAGVDAFIIQDLGASSIIHKEFPFVKLHASTQAAGHNTDAAKTFASLGFSRMVAARELSRENLRILIEKSPVETEIFIHGALCSSYSGRCYMSYVCGGGRSANRGSCAQSCRIMYNSSYPLSLKDLCLAGCFTEILALNPHCLKIEGRMKPAYYVSEVTKIYRRLIDENRNALKDEIIHLKKVFSREGFTDGYFKGNLGRNMFGIRTGKNILESKEFNKR